MAGSGKLEAGQEVAEIARAETFTTEHKAVQVENGDVALNFLQHQNFEPYSEEEERRVVRKVDWRMIPMMMLVNGIQFIDKNTLGNAGTYGIAAQTNLQGQEFSLLVTIFFIGYLVAQYPANLLMQRYPVGKFLTINFILWGATLAAAGSAKSFGTLAASRFFLGVFESCLNPGFILITSAWWKREEQPARMGLWYSANGILGAPAGLAFWGIAFIHVDGMFPYQWMFIIFGLVTVLVGISLWWILPDSPLTASFLNDRERYIIVHRLSSNKTGVKNTKIKKEHIKETLLDGRVLLLALAVFAHNMTNSLQTTFMGIIIKGFGYTTYEAVLLNIPPGIVMAVCMISVSLFLSSRWGEGKRIFAIILCYVPGLAATLMLYLLPKQNLNRAAHLGALYMIPIVASSAGIMYSLLSSNVAGYSKKVLSGAIFFSANTLANIISPLCFRSQESPRYTTGLAVCIAAFAANICLFSLLYFLYSRENKKRDSDPNGMVLEGEAEDIVNAFSDMTDRQNLKLRYKL